MSHAQHVGFESFWVSAALLFAALVYLRGWVRVRRLERDSIGGWRGANFALGLLFIWLALASPLAELDHIMLTAHMVQHLLLMTLAPPLILLGVKPLLPGLGGPIGSPLQAIGRTLTHPALCWFAAAATLVVWHIPSMFILGLGSPMWHGIEQASFLATGLLFWWPVVQPWSSARRAEWLMVVYLFLATLPCDILSGFLVFCDRVVYPGYLSSSHPLGLSLLEDQQFAGALMWTVITIVYFIVGGVITARLLSFQKSEDDLVAQQSPIANALPLMARRSQEGV
jgi:putative membrane protein